MTREREREREVKMKLIIMRNVAEIGYEEGQVRGRTNQPRKRRS